MSIMSTALCLFRTSLYHRLTQYLCCRLLLQLCSSTWPSMMVWLPLATASAGISPWLAALSPKVSQPQINSLPSDAFTTCFPYLVHWYLIQWSFSCVPYQSYWPVFCWYHEFSRGTCHFDNRHTQHCSYPQNVSYFSQQLSQWYLTQW